VRLGCRAEDAHPTTHCDRNDENRTCLSRDSSETVNVSQQDAHLARLADVSGAR